MPKYYIGLMSGTSLDALDAVLVDFETRTPQLLGQLSLNMPEQLREKLIAVCSTSGITYRDFAYLDVEIARLSASAVSTLLTQTKIPATDITAIGSHGQTLYHNPHGAHPTTLQVGDPNIIAELTQITTIADFRRRDIAACGQGAPLVPAFHQTAFHAHDENRIILNIGGIANITSVPRDTSKPITGFDTGPGNVLMDYWYNQHHTSYYDNEGTWAATGKVHTPLLNAMLSDTYFSSPPPKSTGREHFHAGWLNQILADQAKNIDAEDIQATLCELTATSIAAAIKTWGGDTVDRVIVCGGGAHNTYLMARLHTHLTPTEVEPSTHHGIAPDWVEAIAFAWLAKQTNEAKTGNIPSVTGAKHPLVLGGIYQQHRSHEKGWLDDASLQVTQNMPLNTKR